MVRRTERVSERVGFLVALGATVAIAGLSEKPAAVDLDVTKPYDGGEIGSSRIVDERGRRDRD